MDHPPPTESAIGGILVVDSDPDARSLIAAALPDELRPLPGTLADLREICRTGRTGVVTLGPSFAAEELLLDVEALDLPGRGILGVLVARQPSEDLFHAALRAGLRDVISLPDGLAALPAVLEHLAGASHAAAHVTPPNESLGRVTAIASAKGGVGVTTVTVNLAAELAHRGQRVIIIDADLQFGDVALHLSLRPTTSIAAAVDLGPNLNARRLDGLLLTDVRTGVRVLASPPDPAVADLVDPASIGTIVEVACQLADVVLVDTPSGMGPLTLNVLELADRVGLVTTASVGALHGSRTELNTLAALHLAAKAQLILNRVDAEHHVNRRRLAHWAHLPVVGYLPESRQVTQADSDTSVAVLAAPRSRFAQAISELATDLVPDGLDRRHTVGAAAHA